MTGSRVIRVYSDSSGYSILPDPRWEWAQNIRAFLKDQVTRGVIEIRFSWLHPLEGAHIEDHAKPMVVTGVPSGAQGSHDDMIRGRA